MIGRPGGKESYISVERLRYLVDYNPESGRFYWRVPTSNRVSAGSIAGRDNGNGYRRINIDGRSYYAHRLAWLYVHGVWPTDELDHRDGDRSNNRIENLREATRLENCQNQPLKATNKSGRHGVAWSKLHQKWEAYIWTNRKKKHLGLFGVVEEAGQAYLKAKKEEHSFQPQPRDIF